MNKTKAVLYGVAKFTAQFTTAIFLLTTPALLIIQGGDALLPYEAILTTSLSAVFFGWSTKTAYQVLKL